MLARLEKLLDLWGPPGVRLLIRLGRAFRLSHFQAGGHFGCDDPAQTGRLFGYLQALSVCFPRRLQVTLQPDFVNPAIRGHLYLAIHLYLGYLLLVLLGFASQVACRYLARRRFGGRLAMEVVL